MRFPFQEIASKLRFVGASPRYLEATLLLPIEIVSKKLPECMKKIHSGMLIVG